MFQRSPCRLAVVLEDQDVFEAPVFFQVNHAVAEGPDHIFHALDGKRSQRLVVIRSLNDDLMCAYAVHLVKHTFGRAIQIAFNSQSGKLVGHNADTPAGRVVGRLRPPGNGRAVAQHLGRRLAFVAGAKWTEPAFLLDGLADKIRRAFRPVGRDDDPTTRDRVFSQFGHSYRFLSLPAAGMTMLPLA